MIYLRILICCLPFFVSIAQACDPAENEEEHEAEALKLMRLVDLKPTPENKTLALAASIAIADNEILKCFIDHDDIPEALAPLLKKAGINQTKENIDIISRLVGAGLIIDLPSAKEPRPQSTYGVRYEDRPRLDGYSSDSGAEAGLGSLGSEGDEGREMTDFAADEARQKEVVGDHIAHVTADILESFFG